MIKGKEVLAIIPARGGSKGVHRKNIRNLNGKPLIAYAIEEAKKSKYIDRVIISTEDSEIAETGKRFGGEIPCIRPVELAQDDTASIDCILHMLKWLKKQENYFPDYVCLLQCTSPLRTFEDIDRSINRMIETKSDGVVSVCEAEVNPYWTNIFNGNRLEYFLKEGKSITRRQELPEIYRTNGAVYVAKTEKLIKEKTFELDDITGYVMSGENSIDIDNELDFKIAELLIKEQKN